MSTRRDPLTEGIRAERPSYQTGVLLDAKDFTDEQSYHRGRLARALAYLHGSGTVAGLAVTHQAALAPRADPDVPQGRAEELVVEPGLAIDRLGRLIELPRPACIRLATWFDSQTDQDLNRAFFAGPQGVLADVFIRFAVCENGKTPAFATGPFDALDAFAPARLSDAWQIEIVLRHEHSDPPAADVPPVPEDPWARFALRPDGAPAPAAAVRAALLQSWREGTLFDVSGALDRLPEHGQTVDPTSVFLARVAIRTTAPDVPGARPPRIDSREVVVDNQLRLFAVPVGLLAHWLGF